MITIVCALEIERRALAGAKLPAASVACCGPGPQGVRRWADGARPQGPVLLCGLAGALSDRCPPGAAFVAAAVIGEDGARYDPTGAWRDPDGPVIAQARAAVTTPAGRSALAERSGADLVDLESAAFGSIACSRGWPWGVVRGVSDGPDAVLPPTIGDWVDDRGRTRGGRVVAAVLTGRASPSTLRRLGRDSAAALRAVAETVRRMLDGTT